MTSLGVLGRRTCALLAVGSAALHSLMLADSGVTAAAVLASMIAGCLYCARDLWRAGRGQAWVVVALMNLAMVALHLPGPAHHHGVRAAAATHTSTVMTAATLVAMVEVTAAVAVLYFRSRHLVRLVGGDPQ